MSDVLQLIGTVDSAATDRVVLVRHADGSWMIGVGYAFPSGTDIPNNALFWRQDLEAFYTWDRPTKAWVALTSGGASIVVEEVDGAPSVNATTIRFDSLDGMIVTDLGGGVARIDLSGVPEANLALNFPTHPVVAISAAGASASTGTIVFSNSNNVSFGMAGQVVTATATVATSLSNIRVSAGTTSNLLSAVTFADSNGIGFGLNAGTITASHNGLTSQSNQNITAANGGFAFQTLSFSNTQGVSFATSAGSAIVASVGAGATATGNLGAIAVNALTTYTSGTVVFSNANNITFGTNAQTITASASFAAQTNQQMTLFATSNTTQSSTGTTNASSIIFAGAGIASVGITNGSIVISVPSGGGAGDGGNTIIAGTRTASTSAAILFSDLNGVSWGLNAVNGTVLTASIATSLTAINLSAGTTNSSASAFNFSNETGIGEVVFGMNAATITASVSRVTYSSTIAGMNFGGLSSSSFAQNTLFIYPHIFEDYLTCAVIKMPIALTNSSSAAASVQNGWTASFAIYTRNATNSTVLTRHYSTTYTMAVSHNSNVSWGLSLITAVGNSTSYSTLTASSAGINLSSSLHGIREIILPMSSLFTPGEYWMAYGQSTSSAGAAGSVLRISNIMFVSNSGNRVGVVLNVTNNGIGQNIMQGIYSASTASPPAGISQTQININAFAYPVFFLSATV